MMLPMNTGQSDSERRAGFIVGGVVFAVIALAVGFIVAAQVHKRKVAAAASPTPTTAPPVERPSTAPPSPSAVAVPLVAAYLKNPVSSAHPCLGVQGTGPAVALAVCQPRQAWTATPVAGAPDTYLVKAASCLTGNGTEVVTSPCADTANQRWRTVPLLDGYELVNLGNSRCLTAPDANLTAETGVSLSGCTGTVGQVWVFKPTRA